MSVVNFNNNMPRWRWRQTWWGVALIVLSAAAIIGVVCFSIVVGYYWWQIKQGRGGELARQFGVGGQGPAARAAAQTRRELEAQNSPYLGNANAATAIVVFVDFKCPNSQAAAPVLRGLAEKYGYKVKIIARAFPLEYVYPGALKLAEVAACAHQQGRYWEMFDALFAARESLPARLSAEQINELAERSGADGALLRQCLDAGAAKVEVNRDYAEGYKYKVQGTPTFFVNGVKVEGVITMKMWEEFFRKSAV